MVIISYFLSSHGFTKYLSVLYLLYSGFNAFIKGI